MYHLAAYCWFQTMKIMGMGAGLNWVGWFLNTFLSMAILSVVVSLFVKLGNLLGRTDYFVILVFLLCFSFSTTMLGWVHYYILYTVYYLLLVIHYSFLLLRGILNSVSRMCLLLCCVVGILWVCSLIVPLLLPLPESSSTWCRTFRLYWLLPPTPPYLLLCQQ